MAGTAGLKWKLLPITLLALPGVFGDPFDLTFYSGDDIYQCLNPVCRRVEQFDGDHRPHCCGTPKHDHPRSKTRWVPPSEDLRPADNDQFFV
jgi:hypothetical protein